MTESWREIPNYPLYLVSDKGRVHNISTQKNLKPRRNGYGFAHVDLFNEFGMECLYIHRLVAEAFIRPLTPESIVRHLNGVPWDNDVDNLEIVLKRRTSPPTHLSGLHFGGRPVYVNELDQVFTNAYEVAEAIDGDPSKIYLCLNGKRKSHLGYTYRYLW